MTPARPPADRGRKVLLGLIAASIAAAGVALGTNEDLRRSVLASAKALGEEIVGGEEGQVDSGG